jgi:hypothetical protein
MARVLALLRLRAAAGQTTTLRLRHQKAHSMDAHFGPLLLPVLRAGDGHDHPGVYVVDWQQLNALLAAATDHQRQGDGGGAPGTQGR